jgi:hypothetical protein
MLLIALLQSCTHTDSCAAMCQSALDRYEGCMEERGLEWGMAYEDEADHLNFCETWVWEQEQLGTPPDCPAMQATFDEGDCEEYDAAW